MKYHTHTHTHTAEWCPCQTSIHTDYVHEGNLIKNIADKTQTITSLPMYMFFNVLFLPLYIYITIWAILKTLFISIFQLNYKQAGQTIHIFAKSRSRSCRKWPTYVASWMLIACLVSESMHRWLFAFANPLWPCIKVMVIKNEHEHIWYPQV